MATFPINYLEQLLYIERLQDRVDKAERQLQKITVRSFYRPTQQQWEDAYYKQTGDAPPIPVGVKLVWYNLKNASAHLYMTTNDTNGGTTSSGTVFEAIDSTVDKSPIRLLGVSSYDTGFGYTNSTDDFVFGSYTSTGGPGSSTTVGVRYDLSKWSQRQLVAMMVFFEIRSTIASGILHFMLSAEANATEYNFLHAMPQLAATDESNASNNAILTGRGLQNNGTDSVVYNNNPSESSTPFGNATGMTDPTTPTGSFVSGVMHVGNPAFQYSTDGYDNPRPNQIATVTGHVLRGAFNTTNMLYNYFGYFQRTQGQPGYGGAPFFNTVAGSLTGDAGLTLRRNAVMTGLHAESKAWLYGIFAAPSDRVSEFDE